jgi:hypothetical protein
LVDFPLDFNCFMLERPSTHWTGRFPDPVVRNPYLPHLFLRIQYGAWRHFLTPLAPASLSSTS